MSAVLEMPKNIGDQGQVVTTWEVQYTQVHNAVFDSMLFQHPLDKLIYMTLLRFAYGKGRAFPGHEKLAIMCATSESSVKRSLARLAEQGLITITPRKDDKEGGTNSTLTNDYTVHKFSEAAMEFVVTNKEVYRAFKKQKRAESKNSKKSKAKKESHQKKKEAEVSPDTPVQLEQGEGINLNSTPDQLEPQIKSNLNNKQLKEKENFNTSITLLEEEPKEEVDHPINYWISYKDVSPHIQSYLHNRMERLKTSLKDHHVQMMEDVYQQLRTHKKYTDQTFNSVLSDVLERIKNIDTFKFYFKKSLKNRLDEIQLAEETEEERQERERQEQQLESIRSTLLPILLNKYDAVRDRDKLMTQLQRQLRYSHDEAERIIKSKVYSA